MGGLLDKDRRPAVRADGVEKKERNQRRPELAWAVADAIVLTKADLDRAIEMFAPEQPDTSVGDAIERSTDALDFFLPEGPPADLSESPPFERAIMSVEDSVVPPVANLTDVTSPGLAAAEPASTETEPGTLDRAAPYVPRTSTQSAARETRFDAKRLAVAALVIGAFVLIGVAGIAVLSRSPRLTTRPLIEGPMTQVAEPAISRPALDDLRPEVGPSSATERSVPVDLTNAVIAPRSLVAANSAPAPNDLGPRPPERGSAIPAAPLVAPGQVPPSISTNPTLPDLRPPTTTPRELEAAVPPAVVPLPPDVSASPASPPTRVTEADAIQTVLSRYRTAFSVLDAAAARAVWPTVDQRALARAFDRLEQQSFEFDACAITVNDVRAVASCDGTARYVPKVGNKTFRSDARLWKFSLRKVKDEWVIEAVDSR